MNRKTKIPVLTTVASALVLILGFVLAALIFITNSYVICNWHLYPKGQTYLDLREQSMTMREYDNLAWRMPGTDILWNVPFQGALIPSDTAEVTLTSLADEEVDLPAYLPCLSVVHAEACTDYPQLLAMQQRYPAVEVAFTLPISGQQIDPRADSVTLTSLTDQDIALLELMPNLTKVDGTACRDFDRLRALAQVHTDWDVRWITAIAGKPIDRNASSLELTGADYQELSVGLADMPNLTLLTVHTPAADGESMLRLREEYPNITIRWDVECLGRIYSGDAAEVDISHVALPSIAEGKILASKFPYLEKFIVEAGVISSDDMAAWRDEVRSSYKVVWTVYFTSKLQYRTDTTYFMPTKEHEYYFLEDYVHDLMYLEDVIAMDVGHHPIHTLGFLKYMPHLKYLVLTDTQLRTLDGLEYCKELVFLEIDWIYITDITPVLGCTALEDLSICSALCDITVPSQLTWLKHLRWRNTDPYKLIELADLLPNTQVAGDHIGGDLFYWRHLPNYYASRDVLGMEYM